MRPSVLCCAALAAAANAQAPGLRDLPVPRTGRAALFSSRDPSGGNRDHGHFLAESQGRKVLAACRGPGRITRIWSANPAGELRITLDGQVAWEGPFAALLAGEVEGFRPPLAGRGTGGGGLSLVPMPFLDACEVSALLDDPDALYYQVGTETRAEATRFDPARPDRDAWTLLDPGVPRDLAQRAQLDAVTVRDGPVTVFVAPDGLNEVVELRITPHGGSFAERDARRVWLEVLHPGDSGPSIAAPLGDLLGVAFDGDGIETLPVHGLGRARVLRLPMPMAGGTVVRLVPVAAARAPRSYDVDVAFRRLGAGEAARLPLRATFHRTLANVTGVPFELVDVTAETRGHYVGAFLALCGASGQGITFLEGDESIAVDGEDVPAIRGTGTEDDWNGAWYFRGGTFGAPWHAVATLDERRGRVAVARFRGPDPVPFGTRLAVHLEHGGANDAPGSDYAATTFWYGGALPRAVPPATRAAWAAPQGAAAPVTVDAGARLALDAADPEQALLLDRDVLVEVPGRPPRILRIGRDGVEFGLDTPARARVSPWLPSIRTFRIAGPFRPSAPRRGVDEVFGPERDGSANAVYDDVVGDGPRGWRDLPAPGTWSGYVDLDAWFAPNDGVVAYAACTVVSPRDQDATLVLGSDDAVKVFLDGREVHRKVLLRGAGRDQDRVPVHLRAGAQTLLIKVEDYAGGFGLYARFEGAADLVVRPR